MTIFVLIPILLALPISTVLKAMLLVGAVGYVAAVSVSTEIYKSALSRQRATTGYRTRALAISIALLLTGASFTYTLAPELLFSVVLNNPLLWIAILIFYSLASVLPQEFVYRHFFFERYTGIMTDRWLFALNVFCFSLCHLFLHSWIVLVLTAVGGILFAYTYLTDRHLTWVTLEHSIYGNIIFTLGIGEMLAFPTAG